MGVFQKGFTEVNVGSGVGNATLKIYPRTQHYGRVQRSVDINITGVGIPTPRTISVKQYGRSEFITPDSTTILFPKGSGASYAVVTGKSNTNGFRFTSPTPHPDGYVLLQFKDENGNSIDPVTGQPYPFVRVEKLIVDNNELSLAELVSIPNDPGASNRYDYSIKAHLMAKNTSQNDLYAQFQFTSYNGANPITCYISAPASDPFLYLAGDETSLALYFDADQADVADTEIVELTSNTNWILS